jgi:hypothetical protein
LTALRRPEGARVQALLRRAATARRRQRHELAHVLRAAAGGGDLGGPVVGGFPVGHADTVKPGTALCLHAQIPAGFVVQCEDGADGHGAND